MGTDHTDTRRSTPCEREPDGDAAPEVSGELARRSCGRARNSAGPNGIRGLNGTGTEAGRGGAARRLAPDRGRASMTGVQHQAAAQAVKRFAGALACEPERQRFMAKLRRKLSIILDTTSLPRPVRPRPHWPDLIAPT